jgi:CBS domain-containing protein
MGKVMGSVMAQVKGRAEGSTVSRLVKEALGGGYHGLRGMIAAAAHRTERRKAGGVTAGDLMTSPAVTVTAEDTVEHAAALMYTRCIPAGLTGFPWSTRAGRLAGIISRADVLAVFDRPDEEIRAEITSQVIPRLSEPSWYSVMVKDGIVTVEGTPETVSIGHQVLARIRHVQGVVAVRDRLVYPVPPTVAAPGPYVGY